MFQHPGVPSVAAVPQEPAATPSLPSDEALAEPEPGKDGAQGLLKGYCEHEVHSWKAVDETKEHAEAWRRRRSSASLQRADGHIDEVTAAEGSPVDEEDHARAQAIERARQFARARESEKHDPEQAPTD